MRRGKLIWYAGKVLVYGRAKRLSGFQFRKKGRDHLGQGLVNKELMVKLLHSLFAKKKKDVTMADVWAGVSSCRSRICLIVFFFSFFNATSL